MGWTTRPQGPDGAYRLWRAEDGTEVGGLMGWHKGDAMPMGAMGDQQFVTHDGGVIGAVMPLPPNLAKPAWNFYFRGADAGRAAQVAAARGGTITHGPTQVPGGDGVLEGRDPPQAHFAVVGPRDR